MSDPVWYRSLYWRIAFGFIALLAILLLAQGLLYLWLTDRLMGGSPNRTPAALAELVATDVAAELASHPELAIEPYVAERFKRIYQPFLVVLFNGQRASNRPKALPPDFGRGLGRFRGGFPPGGPPGDRPPGDRPPGDRPPGDRPPGDRPLGMEPPFGRRGGGPGPGPRAEIAPIIVGGSQVGVAAVPTTPPPVSVALQELGPTLTWFGLGLLSVGATLTALLIFRPAHKRLRTLEQAAFALGEGRTDVRASEKGGDEVSSLARTFNRMATDLHSRATALAQSDQARRQLLADVSHELMTPLSAIRGYVETLEMPELHLDEDTRRRYLGIVEQETHKLEAIIGDLLDLAKLEGGGETLNRQPVAAADLFRRVTDRHEPTLRDRAVTLVVELAPGTPTAWGDAARLEQAIQNVAANAIRHTPAGGRVTLGAEPADGKLRILIRDTGPGIPAEHLPHVFDRFYKVDAARAGTDVPSGSGLGLSIVQAIIARHGGTITASNAPDGGAVFDMRLPTAGLQAADFGRQTNSETETG
jgi:signal transduction histidine kinase